MTITSGTALSKTTGSGSCSSAQFSHSRFRSASSEPAKRKALEKLLADRCQAFKDASAAAGLRTCPFSAGFFVTIPCDNDDAVNEELFKDNIFGIAIGGGIRIAISAITEDACRMVPGKIAEAIRKVNG